MRRLKAVAPALVLSASVGLVIGLKAVQHPDRGSLVTRLGGPPVPLLAGQRVRVGPHVVTPYGDVQVQITVKAGRLVSVVAVALPDADDLSVQLSRLAAPVLRQESLASQAERIDAVSGATYTSEGYRRSLQGALDALRAAAAAG